MTQDIQIMVDVCAKFFRYVRIEGWCANNFKRNDDSEELQSIQLSDSSIICNYEFGLPSPSIGVGLKKKFIIDLLLPDEVFPDISIMFNFKCGVEILKNLNDLCVERIMRYDSLKAMPKFKELIGRKGNLLDIGGRDRSKLDRSREFENDVIVFDVLEGKNVDVVGDAHELTKFFPTNSFDSAMSICVFEHLAMPWKVVLEMNKIMKTGGFCLIYTHQTIGLHDSPWDFYRFSEDTWPTLFNKKTGFEIIELGSDFEQFVIPFIYHKGKKNAEKSAGREASWVIARKISEHDVNLNWDVSLSDFLVSAYPDNEDGAGS